MAEFSFDASFNEDESNFYSDQEYEEFLKNMKKNLQLLDLNSQSAKPDASTSSSTRKTDNTENCFDDVGKDVKADNAFDIETKKSTADENLIYIDKNDSDLQFENFISGLKSALEEDDEKSYSSKSNDSSDSSKEDSEDEENMFGKFLTQMSHSLDKTNVKTPQFLRPLSSVPLRSQSLSSNTDSLDKAIHPRSQSASRTPEFSLSKAKDQAEHDFMSKRKFYAEQMYQFFNRKVFNNKLPKDALLKWNGKMKSTAGFCKCRRENNEYSFHIELSANILTSFDRLQDTLIHEMCHAACWMINHSNCKHGQLWKTWADRCNLILPDVEVPTTCHNYELSYAYVLKCTKCDFKRKRHKMCEKLQRQICPICKAPTELKRL